MIALLGALVLLALWGLLGRDAADRSDRVYSKAELLAAYGMSWRDREDERLAHELADELQRARMARLLSQQPAAERLPARRAPGIGRRVQA